MGLAREFVHTYILVDDIQWQGALRVIRLSSYEAMS